MTAELPDPSKLEREMARLKGGQRYSLINSYLRFVEDEEFIKRHLNRQVSSFDKPEAVYFTDLNGFFEKMMHSAIVGRTGAGKSTLLLTLIKKFMDRGNVVLLRDDGGLEFRYLACRYPSETRVFIPVPDDGECVLKTHGFNCEIVPVKTPGEALDVLGDGDRLLNVMVYDAFCLEPGVAARWYSEMFKQLIYKCMQRALRFRSKLVLAIMELNDIVQPKVSTLTKEHEAVRTLIEYNIRKLRKFNVQLIAETHRFNMISVNVRSQFDYHFIKKSYGYDIWEFMTKNLLKASKYTFWALMGKATTMPPWQFLLFDYNGNYDLFQFGDIPRPRGVECEAHGVVMPPRKTTQDERIWKPRLAKLIRVLSEMGWTDQRIAEQLGMSKKEVAYVRSGATVAPQIHA
ncbi:MAG: DUF87 domain-containing protein [Candidatus Brockarchaeota archaeon]|nr:DUF87 domain-containing protein [Candidatus Brockarchaeota archaeon]